MDDVFDSKIVGVKSKGEWNSFILFFWATFAVPTRDRSLGRGERPPVWQRQESQVFQKTDLFSFPRIIRVVATKSPKSKKLRVQDGFFNMYCM